MWLKNLYQILLCSTLLALVSCAGITLPNTKVCSVSGYLQDGMICAETLTTKTSEMTFDETISFLEADIDTKKPAALCQSASDWNKIKTALDQACELLKKRCTKEIKEQIASLENAVDSTSMHSLDDFYGDL